MNISVNRLIYGVSLMLFLSSCSSRASLSQERVQLNLVSTVQLGAENSVESSVYYKLLMPLPPANSKSCATGFAVNMQVLYLRSNQKTELKAKLEKSDNNYPAALNKVADQFKSFQFPENFFQQDTTQTIEARLSTVLATNSDSVLVLTDKKLLNTWKEKKYIVFTNVDSMRLKLAEMICRSKQMSFTILIEPPVLPNMPKPQPPIIDTLPITPIKGDPVTATVKPQSNTPIKSTSRSNTGVSVRDAAAPSSYPSTQRTETTLIRNTQPVYTPSNTVVPNASSVGNNSNGKRSSFDKNYEKSDKRYQLDAQDVERLGKQNPKPQ
jgi:hypothetical protein